MLKITTSKQMRFKATVDFLMPDGPRSFIAVFDMLPDTEMDALASMHREPNPDQIWSGAADKAVLRRAWVGWEQIMDEETGKPLDYSDEAREYIMSVIPLRNAVIRTYFEAIAGAKRKN